VPGEAAKTPAPSHPAGSDRAGRRIRRAFGRAAVVIAVTASAGTSAWLVGQAFAGVSGNRNAPWILGRAAGITSYVLLVALVALGLVLSHPWRTRIARPSAATRIRVHVGLAVFTLTFTTLHVVVLATDSYAGVGWRGSVLPMAATYRPLPVTLGVIGLYAGLLSGVTAALAGRVTARIWWPIHKVAAVSLVLVWGHGVLAGSDTRVIVLLYLTTGLLTVLLALSRYAARTPADRVAELTDEPSATTAQLRTPRDRAGSSR
jgi:hypothetical protein